MKTKHNESQSKLIEQMKEREERLMNQIELLLTKVGNNYTTINNTNNNTNNIQLNNYGSEDLSHITYAVKTYLIKHPFGAIQQLIEKIHFNHDKPENINLMITNKRDNKISVYEDGKWVYRNKKKTIQRLIDNKYYILDDHYNDIPGEELSEFNHTNYKSFSGKMDDNDKQLLEQLYEDAEIIILNKQ
jgi:ribosomal protein L33